MNEMRWLKKENFLVGHERHQRVTIEKLEQYALKTEILGRLRKTSKRQDRKL